MTKDEVKYHKLLNKVVRELGERVKQLERKVEQSLLWQITYRDGKKVKRVLWEPNKFGNPLGKKRHVGK